MALGDAESMVVKKSLTLENLKHDVRMMKYTLPEALKVSKFFLEDWFLIIFLTINYFLLNKTQTISMKPKKSFR